MPKNLLSFALLRLILYDERHRAADVRALIMPTKLHIGVLNKNYFFKLRIYFPSFYELRSTNDAHVKLISKVGVSN